MFSSRPNVYLFWIQELGIHDVLYPFHVECSTFLAISSFKTSNAILTDHAQKPNIANVPKSCGISHTIIPNTDSAESHNIKSTTDILSA